MKQKKKEKPYLFRTIKVKKRFYNPKYGDQRTCECGHPYERHFDSYENYRPIGCKYCQCYDFLQKKEVIDEKPML